MSVPKFCFAEKISDKVAIPCSVARLKEVMLSERVQNICDNIVLLDNEYPDRGAIYDDEYKKLKNQLPIIFPHAQKFKDNLRKSDGASPSGLAMLDVDHVENPSELFKVLTTEAIQENRIYFAAITPSRRGLRLIAGRHGNESIPDCQRRLASALHIREFDASTKDLARASFITPWNYVLYMDEQGLEFDNEEEAQKTADSFSGNVLESGSQNSEEDEEPPSKLASEYPTEYDGIPYADIIENLENITSGGKPKKGNRNNTYFIICLNLRYICDFNLEHMLAVMPSYGLSKEERRQTVFSAIKATRVHGMPEVVERAIVMARANMEDLADKINKESGEKSFDMPLPKLPHLLTILCRRLPQNYKPAMIIASLPILGALATRARFRYLDEQIQSFSFMSCVVAPAATGKSFIRKPINLLMTPINEQDEIEWAKDREYKEKKQNSKNTKVQPEDPHACPRNNGINISIAKFLQLSTFSEGKHLIGIGEEIDTLLKSEKAGVWSQKSDIYRLAFDNAEYGQNYMSDNSFSNKVNVFYNLLLTGTPNGMYRFFQDVENGLMTRWCFAQLPDMFASDIPTFANYTPSEESEVIDIARELDNFNEGIICCKAVNQAIRKWLEEKRILATETDSVAVDMLRKRCGVIGFRAGYLYALLEKCYTKILIDSAKQKSAGDFATWVAEYTFRNQMELFSDKVEQNCRNDSNDNIKGRVRKLIQYLPETFTRQELIALRQKWGQSTNVRLVLSRWQASGLIKQLPNGEYVKIKGML